MDTEKITKENITDYLLGSLPDTERDSIEDRLFTNENFADAVDEGENDLIDEYVRGELDETKKNKFEQFFLVSTRRREKVNLARVLTEKVFDAKIEPAEIKPEKVSLWNGLSSIFRFPTLNFAAAAVLTVILVGIFLFSRPFTTDIARGNVNTKFTPTQSPGLSPTISNSENTNLKSNDSGSDSTLKNENENRRIKNPPKNANLAPTPKPMIKNDDKTINLPTLATILLIPMSRSDNSKILNLTKSIKSARLEIVNTENEIYQTFRLEITNSAGILISNRNFPGKLKPKSFTALIPAEKLAEGEYEITLSGAKADNQFQELNYYRFSVHRK